MRLPLFRRAMSWLRPLLLAVTGLMLCGSTLAAAGHAVGDEPTDPTWTARARAVQAQADFQRGVCKRRLQRQLRRLERKVGKARAEALALERRGEEPSDETLARLDRIERSIADAREDLRDLQVASEGSFDRFRVRVESDFSEIRSLLGR